MSSIIYMVTNGKGWSTVDKLGGDFTPDSIGVKIDGKIVNFVVGTPVILETKKVKTVVNKGLCKSGFYSSYNPITHVSTLTCGQSGVAFKLTHDDSRIGKSRTRGGGRIERIS